MWQSVGVQVRIIENDPRIEILYVVRHERRINTLTTANFLEE